MGKLLRLLGRMLGIALAALLLAAAVALWWVGQTTSFVRWALGQAATASGGAVEIGAVQGTLASGVRIASLRWHDAQHDVELRDLALAWRPERLLRRELRLTRVEIGTVSVRLAPSEEPFALPASLRLPMAVTLDALGIGRLEVAPAGMAPIELERVSLAVRYRTGTYRVRYLAAQSRRWGEASLRASLGDTAPYALELSAAAAPRIEGWSAMPPVKILADGTLENFALAAQALAPPGAAASSEGPVPAPVWLALDTRVRPLAAPGELLAPIQITLNGVEPAQLGVPTGLQARLSGSATVRIEAERIAGQLAVRNALAGAIDRRAIPLASLETGFAWSDGRLALEALRAALAGGGAAEGEATLDVERPLTLFGHAVPAARARLRIRDVDLSGIASRLQATRLSGTIRVEDTAFDLEVADASRRGIAAGVRARIEGERLQVERARLQTPAGTVSGSGRVELAAPYAVDVSGEFDRLDPAAALALQQALGGPPPPQWLSAQWLARLEGALSGRWAAKGQAWPDPALATRLVIERGVLDGQPLRLDWTGEVTPTRLAGVALALASGDLRIEARGSLGRADDRLRWRVQAGSLARVDAQLGGSVSAEGVLSGGWRAAPLGLAGDFTASRLRWQDRLRVGTATGHIELPNLEAGRIALRLDGTALQYGDRLVERLHAQVDGDMDGHRVQLELAGPQLAARASARGALARQPAWRWSGTIDALQADAPVSLRLEAPAQLTAQADVLVLGEAALSVDGGRVRIAALSLREGGVETRGEASALPVGRWAQRFAEDAGAGASVGARTGAAAGAAAGAGTGAADGARAIAEGAPAGLADLRLDGGWALAGESLRRASGRVTLRLTAEEISGGGDADVRIDEGRLDGRIDLRIPTLAFANRLIGPEWAIAGRLRFTGSVGGTLESPRLQGDLSGRDLALLQRALGWRLTGGTLDARFEGDRLELKALRLESGEGSVTMDGNLALEGMRGDFRLRAERLPVPFGPGQRVVVSGDSTLASRGGAFEWKGRLRADEGLIELRGGDAPHLPDDVVIVDGRSGAPPREGAAPRDDGLHVSADLTLDLGERLRVRGSGIDVLLAGSLNLQGTLPAAPRAYGTVSVRKGTYSAYGQKLEITRGQILFNGPLDNPVLDIVAMRRDQPVEAGVSLTGTVLTPRVRLVSQPDVPDSQKLSWLVLGVGLDDARSGGQIAALQAAAATLLGQSEGGGLTSELSSALGLDLLTVRSANGGAVFDPNFGATFPGQPGAPVVPAGDVGGNVIALGKRLGSRVFVTYEQGLRGVWNVLRVQYDITHRLSLRAQTGTDSAIDMLYLFSFD